MSVAKIDVHIQVKNSQQSQMKITKTTHLIADVETDYLKMMLKTDKRVTIQINRLSLHNKVMSLLNKCTDRWRSLSTCRYWTQDGLQLVVLLVVRMASRWSVCARSLSCRMLAMSTTRRPRKRCSML